MLIEAKAITKSFAAHTVLDHVDFLIDRTDKIALVGQNGSGKTTFLRILAGVDEADEGKLMTAKGVRIGYLSQALALDDALSIYEEVKRGAAYLFTLVDEMDVLLRQIETQKDPQKLQALNERYFALFKTYETMGGYEIESRIRGVLHGFGFAKDDFSMPVAHLSGGQKMRVAFAKLLVAYNDVLLLDEPTNYLDHDGIVFLEEFLAGYQNAVVVVSHDRAFLDKFCTKVARLHHGRLTLYTGNYTAYMEKRRLKEEQARKAYALEQKEIQRQQAIIQTLKSFNREKSVRAAESREKQLAKRTLLEKPAAEQNMRVHFDTKKIISNVALYCYDVAIGYDKVPLARGLDLSFLSNDKVAVVGPNGCGKTTLIKTLCARLSPLKGEIKFAPGVKISYFDQHADFRSEENTVYEEVLQHSGWDVSRVRALLARMLFGADAIDKKLKVLSGGERARVKIAKLLCEKSNVLLLDEPTNHLDVESKEIFEQALYAYEGLVIAVSHDRYFLKKIFTKTLKIDQGTFTLYEGPFDETQLCSAEQKRPRTGSLNEKPAKKAALEKEGLSKNEISRLRREMQTLEEDLQAKQQQLDALESALSCKENYSDNEKLRTLTQQAQSIAFDIEQGEKRWVEIGEILSNID